MPEAPTKEGQNSIISFLQKIFSTILSIAVASIFAWAAKMSSDLSKQKDEYDQTVAELRGEIKALDARITDDETDIGNIQEKQEQVKDDHTARIIRMEDWVQFHNLKNK